MLAPALGRCRESEHIPHGIWFLRAHEDLGQLGTPTGQGSRLVQHHDPDVGRALHGRAVADQEAGLGPHAGAHHQGGRGGQAHGARAGDDQHADGAGQGHRQPGLGAEEHPGAEGQGGHDGHGGHEPADNPVHRPLDWCLGPLGVLHQPSDLGQGRVRADPVGADGQRAGHVQRRAGHPVAFGLLHRHRLAGEHRLVRCARAVDHHAVDRDPLAGSDPDQVADPDLVRRDLRLGAVPDDAGRCRLPTEERPNGPRRLVLGPGFEPPADQDEADDDRRGLVERVERQSGGHGRGREQGDRRRVGERRPRPQGHQGVHGQLPVGQATERAGQEPSPEDHLHERRGEEQDEVELLHGQRRPAGPEGDGHHDQTDADGGHAISEQPAPLRGAGQIGVVAGHGRRGGAPPRGQIGPDVVAGRLDRRHDPGLVDAGRVIPDRRLLGREVDGGPLDAIGTCQEALDAVDTAGAGHALDGQDDLHRRGRRARSGGGHRYRGSFDGYYGGVSRGRQRGAAARAPVVHGRLLRCGP